MITSLSKVLPLALLEFLFSSFVRFNALPLQGSIILFFYVACDLFEVLNSDNLIALPGRKPVIPYEVFLITVTLQELIPNVFWL